MVQPISRNDMALRKRIGAASRVELEYFCKSCKGHYCSTVSVTSVSETRCRGGSPELLVYSVAGEFSAPMRP